MLLISNLSQYQQIGNMNLHMSSTRPQKGNLLHPIDCPYPWQSDDARCAYRTTLSTLNSLTEFWANNCRRFHFSATSSSMMSASQYMLPCEWFFSDSIPVLMRAVLRWDYLNSRMVKCRVKAEPIHLSIVNVVENKFDMQANSIQRDHMERWTFVNAPVQLVASHFHDGISTKISEDAATEKLHIAAFNNWHREGESELEFFNADALGRYIQYWEEEKIAGHDYYGRENETRLFVTR